ncbi:MAG: hypothetical protein A2581_00465 [Candidatus Staskawiczbacteria bacterium RIFOXYD1_FULL_37_110]|nr:MAG: hypothetical protein A2581_00465 [Candidatus Staskawiczbacteria bacterium RIFOXYD1_FULL_37_110]
MENQIKQCQNCKKDFTIEPEDFLFYEKMKVPAPTFCPECRFQRRLAFRNERKLFRNVNARTGEKILTIYPPESGIVVYTDEDFRSDVWDPMDYGVDYDFSKPFFEQILELMKKVPRPARNYYVDTMVNSDYSANCGYFKNCYLLFNADYCEDCAYGNGVNYAKNCYDISHCINSERCYESFWIMNCHRAHFCSQCVESFEIWFCKDCLGCNNCFGCMNLRNKKYCIFNVQYTKKEYEEKIAEMRLNSWNGIEEARKRAHEFWLKNPNKYHQGIKNINSTGAYVTNSKNVRYGYLVRECEDCKYVQYLQEPPSSKNCYDLSIWGDNNQLGYESEASGGGTFNMKFLIECWPSIRNTEYSVFCQNSSNLFGCVGLNKKEYCILNKQYSKKEYENLVEKIKKHMDEMPYTDKAGRRYKYGEFFPIEFSPFAYNQTLAYDHFKLSKEEALKAGYLWKDPAPQEYQITMKGEDLPETIEEVNDDILDAIISCTKCKKAFRVIKQELEFLRHEKIPLPRYCVDCRHSLRISQRLPSKLHYRQCMCDKPDHGHEGKCTNEFETSYAPDRPEIVYCESCYNSEVA